MKTEEKPSSAAPHIVTGGVQELLSAGKALGNAIIPPNPYQPYAIIPEGYLLEPLTFADLHPLPDHIVQNVRLDDAESFILYVKAFSTHTVRIFATAVDLTDGVSEDSDGSLAFTAFLRYHEGGNEEKASRNAHRAFYPVPLSAEFKTWLKTNEAPFNQGDFINFIENSAPDIVSPDSATLMEMAMNFESKANVTFQSRIDRTSGGRQLTFQEQVEHGHSTPSGGQMKVPDSLAIRIPVFEGGKKYDLRARLEYRVSSGRLSIAYILQRPHETFRTAVKDTREEIATQLDAQILTGEVLPR